MRLGKSKMGTRSERFPRWGSFFSVADERGSWTRTFDSKVLPNSETKIVQTSISINHVRGTLRGLHSLRKKSAEWKVVTCVSGEVWDVIVDVDPQSGTFGSYTGAMLKSESADWALIPPGFAHGFITLTDNAVLAYSMTAHYDPSAEVGYRFNDPTFGIVWPIEPVLVSHKDNSLPFFGADA